jgi:ribosomal protein S18 acetylase RimI-like enzyme
MTASGVELIAVDGQRLRLGSWRGSDRIGHLAPGVDGEAIGPRALRAAMSRLAEAGYDTVMTGAVPEGEAASFFDAGFEVRERLHLLAHDLRGVDRPNRRSTRRARRSDRRAVLALDHLAFEPFWRLDETALEDSLHATPVVRFRVSTWAGERSVVPARPMGLGSDPEQPSRTPEPADPSPSGDLTAYAVFGCGGDRGYVQRLAVHPRYRGRGLAEALLADGLRWLTRRGARSALVNTQEANDRALRLYQRVGFVLQPDGIIVLSVATRA